MLDCKQLNMKFVKQFLLILFFSFLGELLHYVIPLPFPAGIYGIVLLFAALSAKVVKVKDVREVSVFLIAVMPVMFIPAAVGLIDAWGDIRSNLLQYVVVTVVSTFVVMAAAGWVTQYVVKGRKGKE